jgi:lysophospholipase L1-like esterase
MIFPRLHNPKVQAVLAGVYLALAAAAILLSRDILEVRRQRAFYEVDLTLHGAAYWKGRKGVDISSPQDKLPVQLPGPSDAWAGGEGKEIRIKAPFRFKTAFTVFFLESHEAAPPFIEVWAGGAKVAGFQVEKGTGLPAIHWPREGKTSRVSFTIPASLLKEGTVITFRTVAGSWVALQTITAAGWPERWEYAAAGGVAVALIFLTAALIVVAASGAGAREIFFSAILVLVGLSAGLAAGEIVCRVFDVAPRPMRPQPVSSFQLSANPVTLYENRPNLRHGDGQQGAPELEIDTNSAGFRDVERSVIKPEGVFRIIVVGDSTTAGSLVRNEEALFTRIMEKELNAGLAKPRFEALNMGVMGYQTLQEVENLRVNGVKYRPDLVIVLFCHNDFQLNVDGNTYYNLLRSNPDFKFKDRKPGLLDQVVTRSRLAFVVYNRLLASIAPPTSWDVIVNEYKDKYLGGRSPVEAGMELFSAMAREHGFTAVMAILPVFDRPFGQYRHGYQHDRVREIVARFGGIELWDLKDDFAKKDNEAGKFTFDGLHMNEAGHRAMGEIMTERVRTRLAGRKL